MKKFLHPGIDMVKNENGDYVINLNTPLVTITGKSYNSPDEYLKEVHDTVFNTLTTLIQETQELHDEVNYPKIAVGGVLKNPFASINEMFHPKKQSLFEPFGQTDLNKADAKLKYHYDISDYEAKPDKRPFFGTHKLMLLNMNVANTLSGKLKNAYADSVEMFKLKQEPLIYWDEIVLNDIKWRTQFTPDKNGNIDFQNNTGCFITCDLMLSDEGVKSYKGHAAGTYIQTAKAIDKAQSAVTTDAETFKQAIAYIDDQLFNKQHGVKVGVNIPNHDPEPSNDSTSDVKYPTTDHWVVVYGKKYDEDKKQYYYLYKDPASANAAHGDPESEEGKKNKINRLYIDEKAYTISGRRSYDAQAKKAQPAQPAIPAKPATKTTKAQPARPAIPAKLAVAAHAVIYTVSQVSKNE